MDVETIKAAITTLSEPERRALADWLQELEDGAWDVEMERDFSPAVEAIISLIRSTRKSTKVNSLRSGVEGP